MVKTDNFVVAGVREWYVKGDIRYDYLHGFDFKDSGKANRIYSNKLTQNLWAGYGNEQLRKINFST